MELEDLTFVGICICLPLCLHFCTSCNFFRSCFFSWWPCWFQTSRWNKTEKARKLGDGDMWFPEAYFIAIYYLHSDRLILFNFNSPMFSFFASEKLWAICACTCEFVVKFVAHHF